MMSDSFFHDLSPLILALGIIEQATIAVNESVEMISRRITALSQDPQC